MGLGFAHYGVEMPQIVLGNGSNDVLDLAKVESGKMDFLPNGSVSMPIQINEVDGSGPGRLVKAGTMAK